ncbi:S-methyl-5'-thioadenosine phosphorylase [Shewanella sp. OPT22]|nr:S-methyl-5'-thioadenosine phosphorylase [Shewanella sp. OPT22]
MLAIIGGTGIYNIDDLITVEKHDITTPFGKPSAEIVRGVYHGKEILFLPRHGSNHQLLPSEVNYKANIWALKSLGVKQIIGLSAVGSLQQEVKPGDLAIADQYFDFVKGHREKSFFGNGLVAHVSTAEPTCSSLADGIAKAAAACDITLHRNKTYACVDGPRLGTKAESLFLKSAVNADLVGMTNVPEVFLAREAQICYCTIGIATDYDCWQDDPKHHVTVEQVISRYGSSLVKAKQVLETYIQGTTAMCSSRCNHSLECAVLTPIESLSEENKHLFEVLSS